MTRSTEYFFIRMSWVAVALWAMTVFILSSMSGDKIEPYMLPVFGWDKIVHAAFFGTGALLLGAALRFSTNLSLNRIAWYACSTISLYGMLDEWHQLFTPKRSGADVGDWTADSIGALVAVLVIRRFYGRTRIPEIARENSEPARRD